MGTLLLPSHLAIHGDRALLPWPTHPPENHRYRYQFSIGPVFFFVASYGVFDHQELFAGCNIYTYMCVCVPHDLCCIQGASKTPERSSQPSTSSSSRTNPASKQVAFWAYEAWITIMRHGPLKGQNDGLIYLAGLVRQNLITADTRFLVETNMAVLCLVLNGYVFQQILKQVHNS